MKKNKIPEPRIIKEEVCIKPSSFKIMLARPFIFIAEYILKEKIYYFKNIKK